MNRQDMTRLNNILNRFTASNVQLRKNRKTEALNFWQPKAERIVDYVKRRDARFARLSIFHAGSYYDRVKVGEPDEFDLMLVVENLTLDAEPYEEDEDDGMREPPTGYTRVMIDRGEEVMWQQDSCVNSRGMLNAVQVKAVFVRLIRSAIKNLGYEQCIDVETHGPAATLQITDTNNGRVYSVDLVLVIRDKSWPEDAEGWRQRQRKGWPKPHLVQEICQDGCFLVTRQPKGGNVPDREKGFLWLFTFPAAEKKLFHKGGHGEQSSCRKQVLRIMKALKEQLNLHPLKSYHLKTMLFYECEANPHANQWSSDRLSERFIGLLQRLENCLKQANCPHYFIQNFNLFEWFPPQRCAELAGVVQQIRLNPENVFS